MQYRILGKTGLKVSVISLGTTLLGKDYGFSKKPSQHKAIQLIHFALGKGITLIDTAPAYGNAEEIIGKALKAWRGNLPFIATKICPFSDDTLSSPHLLNSCIKSVETSLKLLAVDKIDILQVHQCGNKTLGNPRYLDCLREIKASGRARFLGVSVYGEDMAGLAFQAGIFDVIQLALSIFDQRMEKILGIAREKNMGVIVRSAFLRGLLTAGINQIPQKLIGLKKSKERLNKACKDMRIKTYEAALCFPLLFPAVSSVLAGVENSKLLEKNINALRSLDIVKSNFSLFKNLAIENNYLISPSLWDKDKNG